MEAETASNSMTSLPAWKEAGKKDLEEGVTFLKQPEQFTSGGAKNPRGLLLVAWPPGTGQDAFGQAIAGGGQVLPFVLALSSENLLR